MFSQTTKRLRDVSHDAPNEEEEYWANEAFLSVTELRACVQATSNGSAAVRGYLRRQRATDLSRQVP